MKLKISLILNVIIFVLVCIGTILMLFGIQFMGPEDGFSATKIEMFRFYTVDSNILMGIASFIFIVWESKILKGSRNEIPEKAYVFKLITTVGVSLTFLTVVLYLAPIASHGYFSMFRNSNLFFHFFVPVFSIISFCFCEKTDTIAFKHTFTGTATMVIYALFYTTNVLVHAENGKVSPVYDWYWFVQNGIWSILVVIPIMLIFTYFISFTLWKINKKSIENRNERKVTIGENI